MLKKSERRCKGRKIKATPANFHQKYDQCGEGWAWDKNEGYDAFLANFMRKENT
jgi:hypothetical protein